MFLIKDIVEGGNEMRDLNVISREYVERELKIHNIPGMAIGVIKDGKTILSEGYGVADVDKKTKITVWYSILHKIIYSCDYCHVG